MLQWLLIAAVVAGLGWLGVAFLLTYLRLPPLPEVIWWGYPPPLILIVGGVLAGLLVAGLSRIGVEVGARRRVRAARRALLRAIEQVTATTSSSRSGPSSTATTRPRPPWPEPAPAEGGLRLRRPGSGRAR